MASNSTASYGTAQQEKNKLPFYRITSRSSTESTRSTDALIHKEAKEESKSVSSKAIFSSKRCSFPMLQCRTNMLQLHTRTLFEWRCSRTHSRRRDRGSAMASRNPSYTICFMGYCEVFGAFGMGLPILRALLFERLSAFDIYSPSTFN